MSFGPNNIIGKIIFIDVKRVNLLVKLKRDTFTMKNKIKNKSFYT